LAKANVAIIGGTGFEKLFEDAEGQRIKTRYGTVSPVFTTELKGKKLIFLPRHGSHHSVPPHKINYRANILALHQTGIERILATNAVGTINRAFKPGDLVVPHDFIDLLKPAPRLSTMATK
jgi:5'-methylthioadenosine phosphorylase